MVFLTSINAKKYVCLVLGVNCTARDAVRAKFTRIPSIIPHYIVLVLPSFTRCQVNAVELATSLLLTL